MGTETNYEAVNIKMISERRAEVRYALRLPVIFHWNDGKQQMEGRVHLRRRTRRSVDLQQQMPSHWIGRSNRGSDSLS